MMNLAEYRNRTAGLADFLPWAALVARGVVLNKDGCFQRTARFRGPDLDSATPAELVARRRPAQQCPPPARLRLGDLRRGAAPRRSDLSRRAVSRCRLGAGRCRAQGRLRGGGRAFRVQLLPHLPLAAAGRGRRARRELALRGPRRRPASIRARSCAASSIAPTACSSSSKASCPNAAWLDDAETLTYLHSTVSTKRHRVRVPETPMYLDALLADQPLDRRARAAARRRASAHRSPSSVSRPRPRPASSTSSTGSPFPIAGRRARSCSTRPTRPGC